MSSKFDLIPLEDYFWYFLREHPAEHYIRANRKRSFGLLRFYFGGKGIISGKDIIEERSKTNCNNKNSRLKHQQPPWI